MDEFLYFFQEIKKKEAIKCAKLESILVGIGKKRGCSITEVEDGGLDILLNTLKPGQNISLATSKVGEICGPGWQPRPGAAPLPSCIWVETLLSSIHCGRTVALQISPPSSIRHDKTEFKFWSSFYLCMGKDESRGRGAQVPGSPPIESLETSHIPATLPFHH